MKLLIVESRPQTFAPLCAAIRQWGYVINLVDSNAKAWELIVSFDEPFIALIDFDSAVIDGRGLCTQICNRRMAKPCYVIMATERSGWDTVEDGLDAGADDYISKSVSLRVLAGRLAVGRRVMEYQEMLEQLAEQLVRTHKELKRRAAVDGLTGSFNRRYFEERFLEEWRRATRDKVLLSMILLDIDYFKEFNDVYGNEAGDSCLRVVASSLQETVVRGGDLIARYHGGSFICLLPNTDGVGAVVVAEALRLAVVALKIPHVSSPYKVLTISVGVETLWPERYRDQPEILSDRVTQALQQAKSAGRNIVRQFNGS